MLTEGKPPSFQSRVWMWMQCCFGNAISMDPIEREQRLLEEVLELVQTGHLTREAVHGLVDYVYDRPVGERVQELGGVMVTLSAYCGAHNLNMVDAGEIELRRISQPDVMEKIRRRQETKPRFQETPSYPVEE